MLLTVRTSCVQPHSTATSAAQTVRATVCPQHLPSKQKRARSTGHAPASVHTDHMQYLQTAHTYKLLYWLCKQICDTDVNSKIKLPPATPSKGRVQVNQEAAWLISLMRAHDCTTAYWIPLLHTKHLSILLLLLPLLTLRC